MKWIFKTKSDVIAEYNDLREELEKVKERNDDAEYLLKDIRDRASNRWYKLRTGPGGGLDETLEERELEYIQMQIDLWLGRQD